jgi:hypothetical protein
LASVGTGGNRQAASVEVRSCLKKVSARSQAESALVRGLLADKAIVRAVFQLDTDIVRFLARALPEVLVGFGKMTGAWPVSWSVSGLRPIRTLVLVGALAVAAAAAPGIASAERVKATLTFVDGNGQPSPIRRATVEIWRKYGSFIPTWRNDFTVTTDDSGSFDVTIPTVGAGAVYGLRVYAINDAAIVRFRDRPTDAMYEQPGPPGAPIQKVSNSPSDVLDFSWKFTDPATVAYYNIADALIYGRDYALARRAPGEPEIIKQLTVSVESGNTFYDPYVHWMRLNPGSGYAVAMDDLTILHEYGHFLEEQLSSFMALASAHDGCNVQLWAGGPHAESPGFAWMEGFADYFAQAVKSAYGTKISGPGLGTPSVSTLESPSCAGGPFLPGEWLENFVAGALWDLHDDSGAAEPADRLCGKDDVIFSIFDRELQRRPPSIQAFADAWVARGLDVPPLLSVFSALGVNVTAPSALTYFSPSGPADLAVWRGSESGAWYILGRSGPHWGTPGDIPVPADYDGDGQTDAAVWRPSTGEWFVLLSASGGVSQVTQWGAPTDVPLPGDYDGDGETDYAVYRPSQNAVLVQNDSCGAWQTIDLSARGIGPGTPVVGDVDGDGRDDPGIYNAATGNMSVLVAALKPFSTPWVKSKTLATSAIPAIADYDGDYKDDLATYTPRTKLTAGGIWTMLKSSTNTLDTQTWGGALGDRPVPADYDGAANSNCDLDTSPAACVAADLAVWNSSTGNWTIRRADGSARIVQWGQSGDIPIPR